MPEKTLDEILKKRADEFNKIVRDNSVVKELLELQAEGRFTPTEISVNSYLGFLKFISHPGVEKLLPKPARVLDVGAYLNFFSQFMKDYKTSIGGAFDCIGLELKPEHCELSNRMFPDNEIICGDAMELERLAPRQFDVIVFCSFFHYEVLFPAEDAQSILRAADSLLAPGGIIAVRSPDDKKKHSKKFFLPAAPRRLAPEEFMPAGYSYSDEVLYDCWFVARKDRR